jgi:hypothetical protein
MGIFIPEIPDECAFSSCRKDDHGVALIASGVFETHATQVADSME